MTDESIQIHFALAQPFAGRERRAFPFHRVYYRRQSPGPARRQPQALLLLLLVNGLCLLGLGRWLYSSGRLASAEETAGKHLQALHSSPKFNFTSATVAETEKKPARPPAPKPKPVEPRPLQPMDHVDPLEPEDDSILVYTLAPHRGDTPMLRNWKLLELAALVAMAAPSPIVLAGENSKNDETKMALGRLEKLVKELNTKVGDLTTTVELMRNSVGNVAREVANVKGEIEPLKDLRLKIDLLDKSFTGLKMELDDLKKLGRPSSIDKLALEDVKERLTNIERSLNRMHTENRTALSPAATAPAGKIKLENAYPQRLMFRINDREFFVESGQSQVVEGVPAGPFTYQVMTPGFGLSSIRTQTLDPNRTFTLTAQLP